MLQDTIFNFNSNSNSTFYVQYSFARISSIFRTLDVNMDKKISISPSNINLIVNKCNGDRETLANELGGLGVTVKYILPGFTKTNSFKSLFEKKGFIHWDYDPSTNPQNVQGVIALSDQMDPLMGGFQCIPWLFKNFNSWIKTQEKGYNCLLYTSPSPRDS